MHTLNQIILTFKKAIHFVSLRWFAQKNQRHIERELLFGCCSGKSLTVDAGPRVSHLHKKKLSKPGGSSKRKKKKVTLFLFLHFSQRGEGLAKSSAVFIILTSVLIKKSVMVFSQFVFVCCFFFHPRNNIQRVRCSEPHRAHWLFLALACVRMCDLRLVDWANFLLQPSKGQT